MLRCVTHALAGAAIAAVRESGRREESRLKRESCVPLPKIFTQPILLFPRIFSFLGADSKRVASRSARLSTQNEQTTASNHNSINPLVL
jgi:hypothetical protein